MSAYDPTAIPSAGDLLNGVMQLASHIVGTPLLLFAVSGLVVLYLFLYLISRLRIGG